METIDRHSFLTSSKDTSWYFFTLPAFLGTNTILGGGDTYYLLFSLLAAFLSLAAVTWALTPGGAAWRHGRSSRGRTHISGPRGLPVLGSLFSLSRGLAHRTLASMAWTRGGSNKQLMALSLGGSTPLVVSSDPTTAREILTSVGFADRPVKQSAKSLMFERAIGFAPNGAYWRLLRKIASAHLFSPRRIAAHEPMRRAECAAMIAAVADEMAVRGRVELRPHLQLASLNNIMGSVFGKRYDAVEDEPELDRLKEMVREGFDLLGAFNWSDYLPWLSWFYDPCKINERCSKLVPRVRELVRGIIEEHRAGGKVAGDGGDFVDVLLSLEGEEKLEEDDMIAVLWEMIFRGTDTTALLTEWVMAELILHPEIQQKLRAELDSVVAGGDITDAVVAKSAYLNAVVKETLRVHPPGPLLSWARLSTSDVQLSNGMVVPAGTTAMVNMWAITHDPEVWSEPLEFRPERFVEKEGGDSVDVRGGDLRLAPFGAGRRVCPGKNLGMSTVALWVGKLVKEFEWYEDVAAGVVLDEVLKLSCEMKRPLHAVVVARK